MRLVGGTSKLEGRLEVQIGGQWGTVCDDFFEDADAMVVCRQLDFTGGRALSSSAFGSGTGPILMDDVTCTGQEESLATCRYTIQHNCDHSEDVAVSCSGYMYPLHCRNPQSELEVSVKCLV